MSRCLRVAVDCRRGLGSGVGRVTQSLAKSIIKLSQSQKICPLLLLAPNNHLGFEHLAEKHIVDIPFHSERDRVEYPQLLQELSVDVLFAPQYYIAPYAPCCTIRHIHDLWPLLHPEWIPAEKEFGARFGAKQLQESLQFSTEFFKAPPVDFVNNRHLNDFIADNQNNRIALYYGVMFYLALNLSDKIIVPSQHTLEEIRLVFPSSLPKVSVVPNAVDSAFVIKKFLAQPQEQEVSILHVANWEPRKNIECLLNAFKDLRDFGHFAKLELVGNHGTSDYARKIQDLIAFHPYCESIIVHGLITDAALADLYKKALVFVTSSHYEGFCIPVQEAMASGLPVIASNKTALPEFCKDAALFFDPYDSKTLTIQLSTVISNLNLRKELASKGLDNANKFGLEAFSLSIMTLLDNLEGIQRWAHV